MEELDILTFFSEDQKVVIKEAIGTKFVISTLNEYFCYIIDLANITDDEQYLSKYVVLPLDEEPFIIDANTRAITVPASFKKNGIGVQGDEGAEMLHFIIDRYVDNVDLASRDITIAIQYEGPNGKGVDKVAFKDVESRPNKLIFGWSLDEEVMALPGSLKFAIHFLKGNKVIGNQLTDITYRLSTLTAAVNINKSLIFNDIELDMGQNPSQLIKDRLVNTENQEAPGAVEPVFIINLKTDKQDSRDKTLYYLDLGEENDKYTFEALAASDDAGIISYEWKELGKDGTIGTGYYYFVEITENEKSNPEQGKSYYQKIDDKYVWVAADEMKNNINTFYYRENCYDLEKDNNGFVGTYFVTAINRTGTKFNDKNSNYIKIPAPVNPQIIQILPENETYLRAFIADKPKLSIEAEPGDVPYVGAEFDKLTYQWYKLNLGQEIKDKPEQGNFTLEALVGETEKELNLAESDKIGWYTVDVIANRNGAVSPRASGIFYRVTEEPTPLTVEPKYDEEDGENLTVENINVLKDEGINVIVIKDGKNCDSYEIEWYEDDLEHYVTNEKDILHSEFANKTEITAQELINNKCEGKLLYCKVINNFNGKKVEGAASRRFNIIKSGLENIE